MKVIILLLLITASIPGQNNHLNEIDFNYLNYTRAEIENSYKDYGDFWIVKDEPGMLTYQGGSGFVSWPFYLTTYYFDNNDSLYQINITLDDTAETVVYTLVEVLMRFRNWYGDELDYMADDDGNRYYYWYFGEEMQEAEAVMFVIKNFKTKAATQITQANLRRLKEVENGQ